MLIDVERGGSTRKALVHPGRNAYLWVLERSADSIDFLDATTLRPPGRLHFYRPGNRPA